MPDLKNGFDQTALVLQGGGALGAYQAGVYEALSGAGLAPDWIAGISIGAVNAALIAGNPPERRIERLHDFWDKVTSAFPLPAPSFIETRSLFNIGVAGLVASQGVPGFFTPRFPPAMLTPSGFGGAISYYDTSPLRDTLEALVDFDLINAKKVRLSLGAVNVRTGNFTYFDNTEIDIHVDHVMASGALPPGFPPIEIAGELYWDGGLVSNTPLTQVLDSGPDRDTLVFQVDLFGARGEAPRDIYQAEARRKDIVYSSRTRLNTDTFAKDFKLRRAVADLLELLPDDRRQEMAKYHDLACNHRVAIVHLIYRMPPYETEAKDYEFSRASMLDHWKAGFADAQTTLAQPRWTEPDPLDSGIRVFDLTGVSSPEKHKS